MLRNIFSKQFCKQFLVSTLSLSKQHRYRLAILLFSINNQKNPKQNKKTTTYENTKTTTKWIET